MKYVVAVVLGLAFVIVESFSNEKEIDFGSIFIVIKY